MNTRHRWLLGLIVCWTLGAVYTWFFLGRGWIPHDEGALAQSAERVLGGALPHRDYAEIYTGGLSYFHALAFRVFGLHLLALRYAFFGVVLLWIPALYFIGTRLAPVPLASAFTIAAVFWSVPNYPAAMPSWFNLFLATFGLAALLHYIDSGRRRFIAFAGFAGGLSVLVKTSGFLFIGAGLLFLLWFAAQRQSERTSTRTNPFVAAVFVVPSILAVLSLAAIALSRGLWEDAYHFVLAGLVLSGLVFAASLQLGRCEHWTKPFSSVVPFMLGAATPLVAFVGVYAANSALVPLNEGVLMLPRLRFDFAAMAPPVPIGLLPAALTLLFVLDTRRAPIWLRSIQAGIGIALLVVCLLPTTGPAVELFVWASVTQSSPVLVVLLALIAVRNHQIDLPRRARWMALALVTAFCSLIAYPFGAPIYFSYFVPFTFMVLLAIGAYQRSVNRAAIATLGVFYLLFGAAYLVPLPIAGLQSFSRDHLAVLDLPRGGLLVDSADAASHEAMIARVRALAPNGTIYAGPDAPQVYFLAGLRNPTPAIFDFLVPDTLFSSRLATYLDSLHVPVVVINEHVIHSPPLSAAVRDQLGRNYPHSENYGRFTIRWR